MSQEKQNIALLLHEYGDYNIETVSFKLSEETDIEFNSDDYILTMDDLVRSRKWLQKTLMGRCLGLAMNLISSDDFTVSKDGDFQSQRVVTEETVSKVAGSMAGSFKEIVTASVIVVDPNREKLKRLLTTPFPYYIESISIGVSYDNQNKAMQDRWKRMLNRILRYYIVLSYTAEKGVYIEIGKDIYMAIKYIEDDGLSFVELAFYTSYIYQPGRMLTEQGGIQHYILDIIGHESVDRDA